MSESRYSKIIQQLIRQGWIVQTDDLSNEVVCIRSAILHWDFMTWAERTYYSAKYGFNQRGILDIRVPQQTQRTTSLRVSGSSSLCDDIVVPELSQVGSNDRLRILLAQSRVAVARSSYDHTALEHLGPDGTTIITTEYLWGLPSLRRDGYIEDGILSWMNDTHAVGRFRWRLGALRHLGGPSDLLLKSWSKPRDLGEEG